MKKRRKLRTAIIPEHHLQLRASRWLNCSAILLALLALCCPANSTAEKKAYALVFVTAYDAAGHNVYGAEVKVRRIDKNKPSWSGFTDHSGEFAQRVPAGPADYIVYVESRDKHATSAAIAAAERSQSHSADEGAVNAQTAVKVHIAADERIDIGFHLP
jgi:hypothetical protein